LTAQQRAESAERDRERQYGFRERSLGLQEKGLGLRERALNSLNEYRSSRGNQFGNTMHTPTRTEVERKLAERVAIDPKARALFDVENKVPIWISEEREPTGLELSQYHQLMRELEQGNIPSIESLGFGEGEY